MQYNEILDKFKVISKHNYQAKCICPNHTDKNASLSINYDKSNGKTLIYCQAGCDIRDILGSVDLTIQDLFERDKIDYKNNYQDKNIEAVYKYTDVNGSLLYEKVRFKGKKFSQRRYIDNCIVWGLDRGLYYESFEGSNTFSMKEKENTITRQFEGLKATLYNLHYLVKAVEGNKTVYIVEGEKDVHTLTSNGLIATSPPNGAGKGKWWKEFNQYFLGANVVILPDNDEVGKNFAYEILSHLKNYAYTVKIAVLSDKEHGDVTDWFEEGNTKEELKEILSEINPIYGTWYEYNPKTKNVKFVQGLLAEFLKKEMQYIVTSSLSSKGLIHIYKDGVYQLASDNWLCSEIAKYIKPRFRNAATIESIAKQLKFKEPIPYDDIHGKENIINLENGLYDIRTGKLMPHTEEYISAYKLKCSYNENPNNFGHWDNFINDLTYKDEKLKLVLQEWAGLTLSNIRGSRVKKALLLYGKGDSGKSKYIEILNTILGKDNTMNLKLQDLSKEFTAANMYGKRIVFNGDLPHSALSDPSMFKEITGGDTISACFKGKDKFTFEYTGVLMFACNVLPYIKGDTGRHLFERFLLIPCDNVIPVEKRDKFLIDKLYRERDYIFMWALEGLKRLMDNDFRFSKSERVNSAIESYMIDCDSVRAFMNEKYEVTGDIKKDKVKCSILYQVYENWCYMNNKKACSSNEFKIRLQNNLNVIVKPYNGYPCYRGIKNK